MFVTSLVFTSVLLSTANLIAHKLKYPGRMMLGLCLIFLFLGGSGFLAAVFPPVGWLALFLPVSLLIWKSTRRGPRLFLGLSLVATVVAFAIPSVSGYRAEQGFARLRARYPFESMEGRSPLVKASAREHSLSRASLDRLERQDQVSERWNRRGEVFRRLHEDSVGLFVRNFGFGVGRMIPLIPSESNLKIAGLSILQPGPRITRTGSPGEWGQPIASLMGEYDQLHDDSIIEFLEPRSFGYVKDRNHVAGFTPHQFLGLPDRSEWLKLQTLDLVGLLLHEEPRVYVSENLPRMDELRAAPTRPLDPFESVALASLQRGEDLWIVSDSGNIRMLGAIRSTKQCVVCHGGERGDLLGAFSYTLAVKDEPPVPATEQ